MKRLCCFSFALPFLTGCWTGGPLSEDRIAYKHDAVRWVYRTGGQFGFYLYVCAPVPNDLLDLQPGDGCVHVREGHTGGQCSATAQASLQVSHVLDLRTGRAAVSLRPARRIEHSTPVLRADRGQWETRVDDRLSVYTDGETGRLYLNLPSEVLVLRVKDPDPKAIHDPFLGVPIAAFRMADDLLIVGLSNGYVVCIDLRKLESGWRGG